MSATCTDTLDAEIRGAATRAVRAALDLPALPVIIALGVPGDLEATDTEVGDRHESIDIGPFAGNIYLRLRAEDLVVVADDLHRLADQIIDGTLDARQARMDAERHECAGCHTLIAPDEVACGSPRCERIAAQEMAL